MIVVDTNVIVRLWVLGEGTELSKQILLKDPDWHVPVLWRSEFRNVLALYIRAKRISLDLALRVCGEAEIPLKDKEHFVPYESVLRLAEESDCTAYDCEFVALAQELRVPLITADKKIIKAFPRNAVGIETYLKFNG